ncbi:transporter substrate-binding domain-containing protein, partial [Pontiellaceae bacterium B12227]|nr:transporter substrate-binding domain-containing protein [Pontiellaceae bacterium B12227]
MITLLYRVLLLGLTAASLSAGAETLNDRQRAFLAEKEEIIFVAQPRHAPFEFIHKRHVTGMNVELIQWMAADLGIKIRIETAPLEKGIEMLRSGEADVVTSLYHGPSRDSELAYSETLKMTPVALYIK